MSLNTMLIESISEVFSALAIGLLPIFLWILVPAMVLTRLFRSKEAWTLGALIGFIAYSTVGPFSFL